MDRRSIIHKLPDYKGYSAYYYYDDEDKIWVGHIYQGPDGKKFTDMVAWYDESEDVMEHLFYSMVDDYISFKAEMEQKYGKPVNRKCQHY